MENGTRSSGDRLGEGNGDAIALDLHEIHIVPGAGCGNHYCGKARVHEASGAPASAPAHLHLHQHLHLHMVRIHIHNQTT